MSKHINEEERIFAMLLIVLLALLFCIWTKPG